MAYYNGKKVLSAVAVEYLTPNGNIKLTQNGSYDVSAYRKAVVSVFPTGTTQKVVDEDVDLFASLPATALPKGTIDYVGGKTQKVNQLAEVDGTYTAYGLTATPNVANNTFTISGTSTNTGGDPNLYSTYKNKAVKQGHKYLIASTSDKWCLFLYGAGSSELSQYSIFTANADGVASFSLRPIDTSYIAQGAVINDKFSASFSDLTDIYGAGNEPTSTSDPRIQWRINFLADNPQYDEGSFVHAGLSETLSLDSKGSEANWFLITLSSTIPIPVSSTAIFASGIRALLAASAAAWKILSTCSCV